MVFSGQGVIEIYDINGAKFAVVSDTARPEVVESLILERLGIPISHQGVKPKRPKKP